MSVDRPRAPGVAPAGPGIVGTAGDTDGAYHDEASYASRVADCITLSENAARRLAEPGRARAFVLDRIEAAHAEVDVGDGRSIVLDGGLYGLGKPRSS